MIRLSKQKLRLIFVFFFLLLAIPAAMLSWKGYEQLRWQSYHQYQQQAQSLAAQIDKSLVEVIAKEEARSDTDYTFLVLAGDPQARFVQRSDLSKYPVESTLPGIIGYFQIDELGLFSSPLLPQQSNQSSLYGISAEEHLLRSRLEFTVRSILNQNELVSITAKTGQVSAAELAEMAERDSKGTVVLSDADQASSSQFKISGLLNSVTSGAEHSDSLVKESKVSDSKESDSKESDSQHEVDNGPIIASEAAIEISSNLGKANESLLEANESELNQRLAEQTAAYEPTDTNTNTNTNTDTDTAAIAAKSVSKKQATQQNQQASEIDSANSSKSEQKISVTGSRLKKPKSVSKMDFAELQSEEVQEKISQDVGKLQAYESREYKRKQSEKDKRSVTRKESAERSRRTEQNYAPQQAVNRQDAFSSEIESAIQINLFESELEPFRVSLLSSGHIVAYRQVWRDKKRIIQGAILSAENFFQAAIEQRFLQSSIGQVSNLNVAYGNNILKTFSGDAERYSDSYSRLNSRREKIMQGEQLFAASLSAPFNQISLIFNVTDMPAGAGASFIIMVAFSLMVVLVLGTYLLYRLTLRQSLLAQQQQDFVSSVSHELRTPLTSIRMYGEILKQGWMSEEKKQQYYDYIYNESERLSRLIANVLQISKVSRNALELGLKPVAIGELVSLIASKIDSQVGRSDFSLTYEVASHLDNQVLTVDADALIQIVINLVDNAIKYAANAEVKQLILKIVENKKHGIDISIRDFGPGIAKEQSKKIFQLFYRQGNELTRECSGTGIGLALVKELAHAMGAQITLKNHSVGAEFVVTFKAKHLQA